MTTQEKALDTLKKKAGKDKVAAPAKVTYPATLEGVAANGIKEILMSYKDVIKDVIPKHLTPERVIMIASSMAARNLQLKKCTTGSIISAVVTASSLGMDPTPQLGMVAFVPRKNKHTKQLECNFQFQYQGIVNLMFRTGLIESISAEVVREKDFFKSTKGLNPDIQHTPYDGDDYPGSIKKVYAIIRFKGGGYSMSVMNKWEVMEHKKFSDAGSSQYSPWNTTMGELWMWKKTALLQASKVSPKSVDYQQTIELDNRVIPEQAISRELGKIDYTLLETNAPMQIDEGSKVDTETGEVIETADAPKMNTDTKEPALFN